MELTPEETICHLAKRHFQSESFTIKLLKGDGSERMIFLVKSATAPEKQVVGIYHLNLQENLDFIRITKKMQEARFPVPALYQTNEFSYAYLVQYLGENNLAQCIDNWLRKGESTAVEKAYQQVISWLIRMQTDLTPLLADYLHLRILDQKSFIGDLAYFKRDFIERFGYSSLLTDQVRAELHEQLIVPVSSLDHPVFVYRDFQSRNIMWWQDSPWFIDYQSAYLGSCFYDLASLFYSSKSGLDEETRSRLLQYYFDLAGLEMEQAHYNKMFYLFVLIRRLRSLGTYGFLGEAKGKAGFINSIQPTLTELTDLLCKKSELSDFPLTSQMICRISEHWL